MHWGAVVSSASTPSINTVEENPMRIFEIVDGATQQVNMLKQQAKTAQKRAKEAALRLKMQKAQQSLAQVAAKPL